MRRKKPVPPTPPVMREVWNITAENIVVGPRLRSRIDAGRVQALAESIRQIGIRMPLTVRIIPEMHIDGEDCLDVPILVTGAHRLEALKLLGIEDAPCIELDNDEAEALLWEIDENLARSELTPAETAEHLAKRKDIWAAKSGETGTNCSSLGGRGNLSFASETAQQTGRSKQDVNRAIARAEKIAPDVIHMVKGTVMDKGVELDALARLSVEDQRKAVEMVNTGVAESLRSAAVLINEPAPATPHAADRMFGPLSGAEWLDLRYGLCEYRNGRESPLPDAFLKLVEHFNVPIVELEAEG